MASTSEEKKASPFDVAGPGSLLSFDYARPMLAKGAKRPLEYGDLEPLAQRDNVRLNISRVQRAWEDERARASQKGVAPFFLWALLAAFRRDFYMGCFLSVLESASMLGQVEKS